MRDRVLQKIIYLSLLRAGFSFYNWLSNQKVNIGILVCTILDSSLRLANGCAIMNIRYNLSFKRNGVKLGNA